MKVKKKMQLSQLLGISIIAIIVFEIIVYSFLYFCRFSTKAKMKVIFLMILLFAVIIYLVGGGSIFMNLVYGG